MNVLRRYSHHHPLLLPGKMDGGCDGSGGVAKMRRRQAGVGCRDDCEFHHVLRYHLAEAYDREGDVAVGASS